MKGMTILTMAVSLIFWSVAASGQQESPILPFQELDEDQNGMISWTEFHSAYPTADMEGFALIAGADEEIAPDEWQEFREAHMRGEERYGPGFHERMKERNVPGQQGPSGGQEYGHGMMGGEKSPMGGYGPGQGDEINGPQNGNAGAGGPQ